MGRALLLIVTGFALTFGSVKQNLQQASDRNIDITINSYKNQLIKNATAGAANMAISQLYRNFTWRAGYDSVVFAGSKFSVTIEDSDDDTTLDKTQVRVTSIAKYSNLSDTTVVIVDKPPFSKYASFVDKMPSNLYSVTGDTMWGPIHTNTRFNFSGTPVFYGKVTSVDTGYGRLGVTNPQFLGGFQSGVPEVELPTNLDILETAAAEGGDLYNLDGSDRLYITFYNDGSYYYETKKGSETQESGTKYLTDYNGVIYVDDGDLYIKGTVSGQVTIACEKKIYIEDDLKYANDPREDPNSQDMIGIVSKKDVIIVDNEPNSTDCEIHGTIMAIKKSVKVEKYNKGDPRGTLTILGGVIVKEAAPYGVFCIQGGQPVILHGFAEKNIYDTRFINQAPPSFPVVEYPQVFSWW